MRSRLIDRVSRAIGQRHFGPISGRVHCFGSFPAGLYLPTADMDLVYASDQHSENGPPAISCTTADLRKVARKLQKKGVATNVTVIGKAKVPIIKFEDRLTGIAVDISFENLGGVKAQATFREWTHQFRDLVPMVALIKQFLLMRGLNEVNTGGLGGFSTICLIVSYLQNHTPQNLGATLLGFLDYYGNKFDLNRQRIEFDPPGVVEKVSIIKT